MVKKYDGTYFNYNQYTKIVRTKRRAAHLECRMPLIKYFVYSVTKELIIRGYDYPTAKNMVINSKLYIMFHKEQKGWGMHKARKYHTLGLYYHDADAKEFADIMLEN